MPDRDRMPIDAHIGGPRGAKGTIHPAISCDYSIDTPTRGVRKGACFLCWVR